MYRAPSSPDEDQDVWSLRSYSHHLFPIIAQAAVWPELHPWRGSHVVPSLLHEETSHRCIELQNLARVKSSRKHNEEGTLSTYFGGSELPIGNVSHRWCCHLDQRWDLEVQLVSGWDSYRVLQIPRHEGSPWQWGVGLVCTHGQLYWRTSRLHLTEHAIFLGHKQACNNAKLGSNRDISIQPLGQYVLEGKECLTETSMKTSMTVHEAKRLRRCILTKIKLRQPPTVSKKRRKIHQCWSWKTPGPWKAQPRETSYSIMQASQLRQTTWSIAVYAWPAYTEHPHACYLTKQRKTYHKSKGMWIWQLFRQGT